MTPQEQAEVVAYWWEKLGVVPTIPSHDADPWFELRESLNIPPVDLSEYEQDILLDIDTRDYIQFIPCNGHGHELATLRLQDHIKRFGVESTEVREWVQAQDVVFGNCDFSRNAGTIPRQAPSSVHQVIRRDQRYQIAAAWFISAHFEEAERAFRRIEPDPTWSGGLWAPYMVGRSMIWQARTEHDDHRHLRLLRRAQLQLESVLRDERFAATHDAARFLIARILTVTDPEAAARVLGLRLMSPLRASSRKQDLQQYLLLLDATLGWDRFPGSLADPLSLGRRDGLTDWIVSFKSNTPEAAEHTINRWRQTETTAWLLAALQKARPGQAAVPDLLEAAAQASRGPGWAGVQYYRAKLLAETGDRAHARQVLDESMPALA